MREDYSLQITLELIVWFRLFTLFPNCRPKLCLEKCDANISTKVSTVQLPKTTTTNTIVIDSPICQSNTDCIDLTNDDEQPKADHSALHSSDIKVPKEFEHILQKPVFVKLVKYDDIEKVFNGPGSQTHSKR